MDGAFGARAGRCIWHLIPGMGLWIIRKDYLGRELGKEMNAGGVRTALPQLCKVASSSPF